MKNQKLNVQIVEMNLLLKPCSFKIAKYAVLHWHYSKAMPSGKLVKYGVWEDNEYIGCVIYGRGANNKMPKSLGLKVTECCELVRVALKEHKMPTSKIVAISLRLLHKDNPGILKVFSYADETNQQHKGIIYKASNWKYEGIRTTGKGAYYLINGKIIHGRSARAKYGSQSKFPKGWKDVEPMKKTFIYIYF